MDCASISQIWGAPPLFQSVLQWVPLLFVTHMWRNRIQRARQRVCVGILYYSYSKGGPLCGERSCTSAYRVCIYIYMFAAKWKSASATVAAHQHRGACEASCGSSTWCALYSNNSRHSYRRSYFNATWTRCLLVGPPVARRPISAVGSRRLPNANSSPSFSHSVRKHTVARA